VFTLLIADDEPLAQVGLKSMLDWEALDVSIVGSSPNGAHALEAIKRLVPDIVIADVRMPIIDGITLIERCREEMDFPPEFIVLSGHADFDYARRAIRSGVVDYLVKLELDETLLRESVEKAIAAVKGKRMGPPSPQTAAVGPGTEVALSRFLVEEAASEAEPAIPAELSAALSEGGIHCATAFAVIYQHGRLSDEERERTYRCVLDTIKHVTGREAAVHMAPLDSASFAMVLTFTTEGLTVAEAETTAAAAVERAREPAERYFGVTLRAGIGPAVARLSLLPKSYRAASRAAATADAAHPVVRSGAPRIVRSAADSPAMARARAELARAVETRSAERLRSAIDAAIAELERDPSSSSETLAACCDLLYAILGHLEGAASLLDSFFPDEAEGYRWLFSAGNPARMRLWLQTVRDGLVARFEANVSKGRNPLVSGVREYVIARWAEKLSLPDVAAHFQVSPNHLSSIFKKYNGTGFAEFVSEVKIEKAKELIIRGRYKMYEVAQLLGYEDAYYFSKVFKRVTGMSPREYHLRFAVLGDTAPNESKPQETDSSKES
jgi:two-component system, response regulator YesN